MSQEREKISYLYNIIWCILQSISLITNEEQMILSINNKKCIKEMRFIKNPQNFILAKTTTHMLNFG